MFIRPAVIPEGMEGAGARFRVRDPMTFHLLADEGEHKPDSDYWLRRVVDGGVEVTAEPEVLERPDDAHPGFQIEPTAGAVPIVTGPLPEPNSEGDAP